MALRVFELARELGVTSGAVLAKCLAEDIKLKNHMAPLSAGLEATIREWFPDQTDATSSEVAEHVEPNRARAEAAESRRGTNPPQALPEERPDGNASGDRKKADQEDAEAPGSKSAAPERRESVARQRKRNERDTSSRTEYSYTPPAPEARVDELIHLITRIPTEPDTIRVHAMGHLSKIMDPSMTWVICPLTRILEDDKAAEEVRQAAALALLALKNLSVTVLVSIITVTARPDVRQEVIAELLPHGKHAIEALLQVLINDKAEEEMKRRVSIALPDFGEPAIEALIRALGGKLPSDATRAVVRALCRFEGQAVTPMGKHCAKLRAEGNGERSASLWHLYEEERVRYGAEQREEADNRRKGAELREVSGRVVLEGPMQGLDHN